MIRESYFETKSCGLVFGPAIIAPPKSGLVGFDYKTRKKGKWHELSPRFHTEEKHRTGVKIQIRSRETKEIVWMRPFSDRMAALPLWLKLLEIKEEWLPDFGPITLPGYFERGEFDYVWASTTSYTGTANNSALDWLSAGGTKCPTGVTSVQYLILAGGGGGGSTYYTGGGGAGGLRTGTSSVTAGTNYPVTGGGAGGAAGTSGTSNTWNSLLCDGGGYGGNNATNQGANGGSGGGSSSGGVGPFAGGTATGNGTGNNGGSNGNGGSPYNGGGGGGASSVGGDASKTGSGTAGSGGNGTASNISGVSLSYACGGGGGNQTGGTGGTGGTTSGGDGIAGGAGTASNTNGGAAVAGRGSGGGGSGLGPAVGGAGSAGVVWLSFTQAGGLIFNNLAMMGM
jgi:hypothetical protein